MSVLDWVRGSNKAEDNAKLELLAQQNLAAMRYAQVVEQSSTSFMIANAEREIIFANQAVVKLLTENEKEIQSVLPFFSASNLIGQNIDIFHANPQKQQNMLAQATDVSVSNIVVGKINFRLTLIPLKDDYGQSIGTAVEWLDQTDLLTKSGCLDALDRSQAVIEFEPDGTIKTANANFLAVTEYGLNEIKGQHHRMFVPDNIRNSHEYSDFWRQLGEGKFQSGEYQRVTKSGKDIWIQASYNPILNPQGDVVAVVKYATDITEQKMKNADFEGQIDAISKSQAVIEFDMNGIVQHANENFLNTVGYTLEEIKGNHHSMFVDSEYRNSHEYTQFWKDLNRGIFSTGEYKRIAKSGKDVWIQASYNPIFDLNGKPFKVVKYATDITGRKFAINEIKRALVSLSNGDLTTQVEHEFEGEFQQLGDALNRFAADLRSMIAQIMEAANTINSASSEIAQGNADLSTRTEQQASSLEETASSMEQLASTVKLNSDNASQANSLAANATKIASDGGSLIEQVVTTMSAINESSQKIADIIGVIDGIAFQTNILSLNAAVEAARAGDQGKGFAVVASEVRNLAQRSAEAAKDIKSLISDSVTKIADGNTLVSKSGETMADIVNAIKRVNDIMSEIAAASAEQASGIDEVTKAVTQMDEATQQNAALVEEAAAAAESMKFQAEQLDTHVAVFNLGDMIAATQSTSSLVTNQPTAPKAPAVAARASTPAKAPVSPKSAFDDDDEWENF